MATFPMSHISLCLSLGPHLNLYFRFGSFLRFQDFNYIEIKTEQPLGGGGRGDTIFCTICKKKYFPFFSGL